MILKSFDLQCDFDFHITTSKNILILNHLDFDFKNHQHMMILPISVQNEHNILSSFILYN